MCMVSFLCVWFRFYVYGFVSMCMVSFLCAWLLAISSPILNSIGEICVWLLAIPILFWFKSMDKINIVDYVSSGC
jgi:hypothetical protein